MSVVIAFLFSNAMEFWVGIGCALLLSLISSIIAGVISLFIGRLLFRKTIKECVGKSNALSSFSDAFELHGLKLNLLLRINPLMNNTLLNYGQCATKGISMNSVLQRFYMWVYWNGTAGLSDNVHEHISW